jgi:hypothetical protein
MSIYHKHHIVPRHMGGTDDPSNLVELTVKEHAEAHRKLFEQYGHWQDELAWKGLAGIIGKEELVNRLNASYGFLGKNHSEEHLQKIIGEGNPFYGKKHSKESRKRISEKTKERMSSPEVRKHLSECSKGNKNWLGKKLSDEHKRKISETKKRKALLLRSNTI